MKQEKNGKVMQQKVHQESGFGSNQNRPHRAESFFSDKSDSVVDTGEGKRRGSFCKETLSAHHSQDN
jgi:hypothetical protein